VFLSGVFGSDVVGDDVIRNPAHLCLRNVPLPGVVQDASFELADVYQVGLSGLNFQVCPVCENYHRDDGQGWIFGQQGLDGLDVAIILPYGIAELVLRVEDCLRPVIPELLPGNPAFVVLRLDYIDAVERHDDVVNLGGTAILVGQQQVVDCDVFILWQSTQNPGDTLLSGAAFPLGQGALEPDQKNDQTDGGKYLKIHSGHSDLNWHTDFV